MQLIWKELLINTYYYNINDWLLNPFLTPTGIKDDRTIARETDAILRSLCVNDIIAPTTMQAFLAGEQLPGFVSADITIYIFQLNDNLLEILDFFL